MCNLDCLNPVDTCCQNYYNGDIVLMILCVLLVWETPQFSIHCISVNFNTIGAVTARLFSAKNIGSYRYLKGMLLGGGGGVMYILHAIQKLNILLCNVSVYFLKVCYVAV